uniref:RING-type domain-containing protein n=1 Tax=viral metagenome TaxID=1070528 RepID=A0A6C0JJ12_9ZZZZ
METVTFKPIVEIKLNKTDLLAYYNSIENVLFPKTKKGDPDMTHSYNKTQMASLKKRKKEEVLEKYNRQLGNNKTKKIIAKDNCPVCYDPLTSMSVLKCGHTFCVSCTISHFRENDSCPLCRVKICEKPVKRKVMPSQIFRELITDVLDEEEEERMDLSMVDYIEHRLNDFKTNSRDSKLLALEICNEVELSMVCLAEHINEWYE